jgi:hypothetical protein
LADLKEADGEVDQTFTRSPPMANAVVVVRGTSEACYLFGWVAFVRGDVRPHALGSPDQNRFQSIFAVFEKRQGTATDFGVAAKGKIRSRIHHTFEPRI